MPWFQQPSGVMPAEAFNGAHFSSPGLGHLLRRPKTWEETIGEILRTAAPVVTKYLDEKKRDKIANYLQNTMDPPRAGYQDANGQWIEPESPHSGGVDEYKLRREQMDADLRRELVQSQIERNERLPQSRSSVAPIGEPRVDPETGLIWNGRSWVKPPGQTQGPSDPVAKVIPWSKAMARGKLNEAGEFTNQYTGAEEGEMVQLRTPDGKTIVVPWHSYQERIQTRPGVKTSEAPVTPEARWQEAPGEDFRPTTNYNEPQSKPLDQQTAKAILAEAGGDKEKARELARQRGFSF